MGSGEQTDRPTRGSSTPYFIFRRRENHPHSVPPLVVWIKLIPPCQRNPSFTQSLFPDFSPAPFLYTKQDRTHFRGPRCKTSRNSRRCLYVLLWTCSFYCIYSKMDTKHCTERICRISPYLPYTPCPVITLVISIECQHPPSLSLSLSRYLSLCLSLFFSPEGHTHCGLRLEFSKVRPDEKVLPLHWYVAYSVLYWSLRLIASLHTAKDGDTLTLSACYLSSLNLLLLIIQGITF